MRDIGTRIQRYRLSRYRPAAGPLGRPLQWLWIALAAWLVWTGLLSDHSFYRLWRLSREQRRSEIELERTREQVGALESENKDPRTRRERTERLLRERAGMAKPGEIVYRIRGASPDTLAP